jgi:hypothetical protein
LLADERVYCYGSQIFDGISFLADNFDHLVFKVTNSCGVEGYTQPTRFKELGKGTRFSGKRGRCFQVTIQGRATTKTSCSLVENTCIEGCEGVKTAKRESQSTRKVLRGMQGLAFYLILTRKARTRGRECEAYFILNVLTSGSQSVGRREPVEGLLDTANTPRGG